MKKYLVVLMLLIVTTTFGQRVNLVSPDDLQGLAVTRNDTFTGQRLYSYLGDRANLYMEFGFKQLLVREYAAQDDKAKLEIYIMDDAPSAYGIYSLSISNCDQWNLYSTFSCFNINQVSAAYGPFFINAVNLSKTRGGQGLCSTIVQAVIAKNQKDAWYLPPLFQQPGVSPYIHSLKYSEGPAGLGMSAPSLSNILANLQFNCYSINITAPAYGGILARIVFADPNSMNIFLMNAELNSSNSMTPTMVSNGSYRSCYGVDDYKIIFLQSNSPDLKLSGLIPQRPDMNWDN
jgi:hypothetical protein